MTVLKLYWLSNEKYLKLKKEEQSSSAPGLLNIVELAGKILSHFT